MLLRACKRLLQNVAVCEVPCLALPLRLSPCQMRARSDAQKTRVGIRRDWPNHSYTTFVAHTVTCGSFIKMDMSPKQQNLSDSRLRPSRTGAWPRGCSFEVPVEGSACTLLFLVSDLSDKRTGRSRSTLDLTTVRHHSGAKDLQCRSPLRLRPDLRS